MMELTAPWGEIEVPSIFTGTFPTKDLKKIKNVNALAKFYKKVFGHLVELMGTPKIHNFERMVFDIQIGGGA